MMKLHELRTGHKGVQELVDALHQTHPTTQANVAETVLKALAQWAEESHRQGLTDLRNERAVKVVRTYLQPHDAGDKVRYDAGDLAHLSMYTC
jgi:hypothetical protein